MDFGGKEGVGERTIGSRWASNGWRMTAGEGFPFSERQFNLMDKFRVHGAVSSFRRILEWFLYLAS